MRAFTLIELLVVISIIAILVALLLSGVGALGGVAKGRRTEAAMGVVLGAIESTAAANGGGMAPAEHPLAGSAPQRARFYRGGTALATSGEALVVTRATTEAILAASADRLLLPTDRFGGYAVDGDCPLLAGVERSRLGILGANLPGITAVRRLPQPPAGSATVPQPYDATTYPDSMWLDAPPALATGQRREELAAAAVQTALGKGASELSGQGLLITATANQPTDDTATNLLAVSNNVGRLVATGETSTTWKPGFFRDGGVWKRYRLRGPAVYDAWGSELLLSQGAGGAMRIESAGPDGVFRIRPGANGQIDTPAGSDAPTGDDRAGSTDNLVIGAGR